MSDMIRERDPRMIEVNKYIVDTTREHLNFFSLVNEYCKKRDNIQYDYLIMIDNIMSTALCLSLGRYEASSVDTLEEDIVDEYFGRLLSQDILDSIHHNIMSILDYYTRSLMDLKIGRGRTLFVDNVNKRGVYFTEYNIEHMTESLGQ